MLVPSLLLLACVDLHADAKLIRVVEDVANRLLRLHISWNQRHHRLTQSLLSLCLLESNFSDDFNFWLNNVQNLFDESRLLADNFPKSAFEESRLLRLSSDLQERVVTMDLLPFAVLAQIIIVALGTFVPVTDNRVAFTAVASDPDVHFRSQLGQSDLRIDLLLDSILSGSVNAVVACVHTLVALSTLALETQHVGLLAWLEEKIFFLLRLPCLLGLHLLLLKLGSLLSFFDCLLCLFRKLFGGLSSLFGSLVGFMSDVLGSVLHLGGNEGFDLLEHVLDVFHHFGHLRGFNGRIEFEEVAGDCARGEGRRQEGCLAEGLAERN